MKILRDPIGTVPLPTAPITVKDQNGNPVGLATGFKRDVQGTITAEIIKTPCSRTYTVNEIFYSPQGEGLRAGTVNFFVRFTGCNMRCDIEPGPKSPGGFACDTEFTSGRKLTAAEIVVECRRLSPTCRAVIFTGGEPGLQLDNELIAQFREAHIDTIAIETNGTINLDSLDLDWITLSPKVAEHAVKQRKCSELKYVRGYGQAIPNTTIEALYKLISPAFDGSEVDPRAVDWCVKLVKDNPEWSLTCQLHKLWKVR